MDAKLTKDASDKLSFVTFIIPQFARSYKMNKQEAYRYLKKYGGIDYVLNNWWTMHTENPFWAVRDMYRVCYKNGGLR